MARRSNNTALWVVLGILGGGFLLVSTVFAGVLAMSLNVQTHSSISVRSHGTRVQLERECELYYTADVTRAAADQLAAYLNDSYVPSNHGASVQLAKPGSVYQVRFVIDPAKFDRAEIPMRAFGERMSAEVFDGRPIEVHLCDAKLTTLKALDIKGKSDTETAKK